MLGWNLGSEYLALGGEVPLTGLPTVESLLQRTGVDGAILSEQAARTDWGPFLREQLARIGAAAIPFAALQRLAPGAAGAPYVAQAAPLLALAGAAAFAASLAGLALLRCRTLAAALLLAGWCWALPFRSSAALHEFEAMFHAGVPLLLAGAAGLALRRLPLPAVPLPGLAAAAVLAFVLSAAQMAAVGNEGDAAAAHRALSADFSAIRKETAGASVVGRGVRFPEAHWMLNYYLAGAFIQYEGFASERAWSNNAAAYDFVTLPVNIGGSLTPQNRRTFLYRVSELPGAYDALAAREPALRAPSTCASTGAR